MILCDPSCTINGPSLITTIDLEIQSIAEKSLSGKSGAIICMNPNNGEIIAFASSPDYDLKPFIGPVPQGLIDDLILVPFNFKEESGKAY